MKTAKRISGVRNPHTSHNDRFNLRQSNKARGADMRVMINDAAPLGIDEGMVRTPCCTNTNILHPCRNASDALVKHKTEYERCRI